MSGFFENAICSVFTQLILFVALVLFIAPSAADAELLLQLHDVWSGTAVPDATRQTARRPVDSCTKSNADLAIRGRDVSLTMAYTPPGEIIEPQERIRIVQRQDCPSISGISLKLSLQF